MSSASCCECCMACFYHCCPQFAPKDKYSSVNYSQIPPESVQVVPGHHGSTDSLVQSLDRLFSFPQQESDMPVHPQMFTVQPSDPVTQQPTSKQARRFSTQSSTGSDYERCIVGESTDFPKHKKSQTLPLMSALKRKRQMSLVRSHSERPESPSRDPSEYRRRHSLPMTRSDSTPLMELPIIEENSLLEERKRPALQFSLHYDIVQSTLMVHLHHASNLPAKDRDGTSDPFIRLHLTPNKEQVFQSTIVYKTLNPVYDQSFQFRNLTPDDIRRQTLILRVYDHDRFTHDDIIGTVTLPLENADLYGVVMRMVVQEENEEQQMYGRLLLSLSYDPQKALLKGVVLKATDLKKQDVVGLADPYIKIQFLHKGKRKKKWKTTVKRNTLAPVFNETFQFELSKEMSMSDVHLELLLKDYDRFSRNDVIGVVNIGESTSHVTGQKHWNDMLLSPQQMISQWHIVMPPSRRL